MPIYDRHFLRSISWYPYFYDYPTTTTTMMMPPAISPVTSNVCRPNVRVDNTTTWISTWFSPWYSRLILYYHLRTLSCRMLRSSMVIHRIVISIVRTIRSIVPFGMSMSLSRWHDREHHYLLLSFPGLYFLVNRWRHPPLVLLFSNFSFSYRECLRDDQELESNHRVYRWHKIRYQ